MVSGKHAAFGRRAKRGFAQTCFEKRHCRWERADSAVSFSLRLLALALFLTLPERRVCGWFIKAEKNR